MSYWIIRKEIKWSRKSKGDEGLIQVLSTMLEVVNIRKRITENQTKPSIFTTKVQW